MLNLLIGLDCSGSSWVVSSQGVASWQAVRSVIMGLGIKSWLLKTPYWF